MRFRVRVRRQETRWLTALFVLVSIGSFTALAQSPILDYALDPAAVTLPLSGSAAVSLRISNTSIYEADDIDVELVSGPVQLGEIVPIDVVDPFSNATLDIPLTLTDDAVVGETSAALQLIYTYCIEDLCYQIVEDLTLPLNVVPAEVGPVEDGNGTPPVGAAETKTSLWPILFPIGLGLAMAIGLVAGRLAGKRWWVLGLLIAVMAGGLAYGLSLKQDQQAQSIGAVLCTSCVGIEETPHHEPELTADEQARIQALNRETELLVFTAKWCHACPYAEALVEQVAELNPLVSYRLIDVDESRDVAKQHGVVQSERTIVPAILRVDTGQILFGIDHLEDRLLAMLEETP